MRPPCTPRFYAGTSGWAYPSWKPGFYPATLSSRRLLEHYASRLNSVEVNYTFRKLPTEEQAAAWLHSVPNHFRFSFKAPEAITHRKRLRECGAALDAFLASLLPLRQAGAIGCLLFQLPPNFKANHERLHDFLSLPAMADAGRVAFEFRHESWFSEDTWRLLKQHGVAVCIAESEAITTPEVHTTEEFACYRLRTPGGYDAASIVEQAAKFSLLSAAREVFVYYKHEDLPTGPLAAEMVLQQAAPAPALLKS